MPTRARRLAHFLIATISLASGIAAAQEPELPVRYGVAFADGAGGPSSILRVSITLPTDVPSEVQFVMPRAIPMGYGRQMYDDFVSQVAARTRSGVSAVVTRGEGPRWVIRASTKDDPLAALSYEVDLAAQENGVLSGGDASRARADFIGLMGYSVFGFVDGFEHRSVALTVAAPSNHPDWPILATLQPAAPARPGPQTLAAKDFYALADSQVWMGTGFAVRRLRGTPDLFLAVHAEGPYDGDTMAPLAEESYAALIRYFGSAPFEHFTLLFDYLKPLSPRHSYGFSMEHLESSTFGALHTAALTSSATDREKTAWRYNVAHHLAHAWTPKRAFGAGYFPFRWELSPLIDTIWFAEGFGQFAAADALNDVVPAIDGQSYKDRLVDARFRTTLTHMPAFLKQMPLVELSRTASTVYSEDFRTGRTVFARGGLMADEMDRKIRKETGGAKGLREGLRALMSWSAREKRGFSIEELPAILKGGTGVDVKDVMERWLAPMKQAS